VIQIVVEVMIGRDVCVCISVGMQIRIRIGLSIVAQANELKQGQENARSQHQGKRQIVPGDQK
jgi:hypothetical protein